MKDKINLEFCENFKQNIPNKLSNIGGTSIIQNLINLVENEKASFYLIKKNNEIVGACILGLLNFCDLEGFVQKGKKGLHIVALQIDAKRNILFSFFLYLKTLCKVLKYDFLYWESEKDKIFKVARKRNIETISEKKDGFFCQCFYSLRS